MLRCLRFLLLTLALACATTASARPSPADLQRLQEKIQALNQKIAAETGSRDALRQEVEAMEKQIAESIGQVRDAAALVEEQQAKIRATQEEQKRAQAGLLRQKQALAQQIRSAYLIGEGGQLRLLLNQADTQKLDRMTTYYQYLSRARARYIEVIQLQLDQITALQDRLAQQKTELETMRRRQQQTLNALQASRSQRQAAIQKIAKRIEDDQNEVRQLQASEKEMQSLLRSLRDALNDIPQDFDGDNKPFAKRRGKLPWPLRGKLLAAFGDAKSGGRITWNGYWIAGAEGAPVRAVTSGRVAYVGWLHRYGLIIILEHEDGYFTLYGHNQSVNKTGGEWVKAGDVVAHAGVTGGYEQAGVYFEIRKGTEPLNPKVWLTK